MTVLASIPSPTQGVWNLGPLPIRAYALCIIAGIVAAAWIAERRWVARGGGPGGRVGLLRLGGAVGHGGRRVFPLAHPPGPFFGAGGAPLKGVPILEGRPGIWGAIAL